MRESKIPQVPPPQSLAGLAIGIVAIWLPNLLGLVDGNHHAGDSG